MGDPFLAPGVSQRDLDGPQCPQCGQRGCDCPEEEVYDPRSFRERMEEEKGEHDLDIERSGG